MKAKMYMLTCQSLQVQLAERTEEASRALASKRELQTRVQQIQRDYEEEQEQTFEMRQDMTRQYKGMQEELLSRVASPFLPLPNPSLMALQINKLEETIQDLNDQLGEQSPPLLSIDRAYLSLFHS
jgi:chromosome segregation ATPase